MSPGLVIALCITSPVEIAIRPPRLHQSTQYPPVNPIVYLRRAPDPDLAEEHGDACRNRLVAAGYPAPRIYADDPGEPPIMLETMIELLKDRPGQVVIFHSLEHLAGEREASLVALGRILSLDAQVLVVMPPIDLRGRDEASMAQIKAFKAVIDFRPTAAAPVMRPPAAGGRPMTKLTGDQEEIVRAHYAAHKRNRQRDLAAALGLGQTVAAGLLRDEETRVKTLASLTAPAIEERQPDPSPPFPTEDTTTTHEHHSVR